MAEDATGPISMHRQSVQRLLWIASDCDGEGGGRSSAMVLDIDETSLSGFCELRTRGLWVSVCRRSMRGWWSPDAAMVIPGTLRLFNRAQSGRG